MRGEEINMFCWSDLAGLVRGRLFPAQDIDERLVKGIGWLPVCQVLTPFHELAEPNPWGAIDDIHLIGDPEAKVRVDLWDDAPPLHYYLSDAVDLDGRPWEGCLRHFLRTALDDLKDETGLEVNSAFEQEFHLSDGILGPDFSLESLRLEAAFGSLCMAGMRQAGLEPETFEPEYGESQYEVTCRPTIGVAGADRATNIREVVREVARREGRRASFTPIIGPDAVGNGVHVHFSLLDEAGEPAGFDESRPGHVSDLADRFVAGVLRQLPAMVAMMAPTLISYLRLVPGHWSAGYNAFGLRNREAAMRIAPNWRGAGANPARQFNMELRTADGAASPHLVLGLIVHAGLQGIRDELPTPPVLEQMPADLSDAEREALGVHRLPGSLEEALAAMEADALVKFWFAPNLWDAYISLKRSEMRILDGLGPADLCERYRNVY